MVTARSGKATTWTSVLLAVMFSLLCAWPARLAAQASSEALAVLKGAALDQIAQGDYQAAQATAGRMVAEHPTASGLPAELRGVADAYRKADVMVPALALYQQILEKWPNAAEERLGALAGSALCRIYEQDFQTAQATVEQLKAEFANDPALPRWLRLAGGAYHFRNNEAEALKLCEYVLKTWPNDAECLPALAGKTVCHIRQGDDAAAQAAVEELNRRFGQAQRVGVFQGQVADAYRMKGRWDKAQAVYQQIMAASPNGMEARRGALGGLALCRIHERKYEAAQALIEQMKKEFPDHPAVAKSLRFAADACRKQGHVDLALTWYQQIVTDWPKSREIVAAQAGQAMCRLERGEEESAQAVADRLLADHRQSPDLPKFLGRVADAYQRRGQFDKAAVLYEQVATADAGASQERPRALGGMAFCRIRQGAQAAAAAILKELEAEFAQHDRLPVILKQVGDAYRQRGDYKNALALYDQVSERWPEHEMAIKARMQEARIHAAEGDDAGAEAICASLRQKQAGDDQLLGKLALEVAVGYLERGLTLTNQGQKEAARACFEKAAGRCEQTIPVLADENDQAGARHVAGECYYKLEDYARALGRFQQVADQHPGFERVWLSQFMVGQCYEKMSATGAVSAADATARTQGAYETLLKKYPQCPAAPAARQWLTRHSGPTAP